MSAPLTTRDDWINAACDEVALVGLAGLTIERIAKTLKVSRIGFYQRFKDRPELYEAVVERWMRGIDELFEKADHIEDPVQRIRQVGYEVLVDQQQRALDRAMLLSPEKDAELAERIRMARVQAIDWLIPLLRESGFSLSEARRRSEVVFMGWLGLLAEVEASNSGETDAQLRARIDNLIDVATLPRAETA